MRFTTLLPAVMAFMQVSALPIDELEVLDHIGRADIEVFKRDAPLDARDLDHAKRHGVDLNEMFKHSVMKRDDGDHVTIWLQRDYVEETTSANLPRGVDTWNGYRSGSSTRCNRDRSHRGDSGPTAPYSGGAKEVVRWGDSCGGYWSYSNFNAGQSINLLIAGSNSGANMRFSIKSVHPMHDVASAVGCKDVRAMTKASVDNYIKVYNGNERLRAHGSFSCEQWNIVGPPRPTGRKHVEWTIDHSNRRV